MEFQNTFGNGIVDRRINIDDDPSTSHMNLLNLCPVTSEFIWLNCIQHVSISSQVSLLGCSTTRHYGDQYWVLFHWYLLEGHTGQATRYLLFPKIFNMTSVN